MKSDVFSLLTKYDSENMYQTYDKWPIIAEEFFNMNYDKIDYKNIDNVIFTGMGGSGAIGDTLSAILSGSNMHLYVVKGYHLPQIAGKNTLIVATSASGNTLETLTVLDRAKKKGCKTIAFSSGGKMEKYCIKNKVEHRKIPIFNSPRASYPSYLYSILNVLNSMLPVKKTSIKESISILKKTQKKISSNNCKNNPSLELAKWITPIPMIYYPMGLQASATRFKNSLQENAKMHAIAEDVIEACHNGIVGWERPSKVKPILLQGKDDFVKTKELWKIVKEYFLKNRIEYREIYSVEGNIISKIVNLVYLLDFATIYVAALNRLNPTPVKSIEFIKKKLEDV